MSVELFLVMARPRADVAMYGDLDAEAASMLVEGVESARIAGCRQIHLHLDGPRAADECFIGVLRQLRRSCTRAGGSFEVEGHGLLSKNTMPGRDPDAPEPRREKPTVGRT